MNADERDNGQRDTYTPHWPPERFIVPLLSRRIPEVFAEFCKPAANGKRVLDAGCGMQPFRQMLTDAGYHYISMDAIQNRAGSVDVIAFMDGQLPEEICAMPPFDLIFCTEVMEHVADWKTAFRNFSQLLAPQGKIFITCPHFYPLHEVPYDFWRPTPHAIAHFAAENGMRVIFQEQCGGPREVLGTLLAETHVYPVTSRMTDRILAKICRIARKFFFDALASDTVQKRLSLKGPYYLSNIAVLEKVQ